MTVKIYIDENGEVENIHLEKMNSMEIGKVFHMRESIENQISEIDLPKDNWFKIKLKEIYEDDGSGAQRFSGFEIEKMKACTRYFI